MIRSRFSSSLVNVPQGRHRRRSHDNVLSHHLKKEPLNPEINRQAFKGRLDVLFCLFFYTENTTADPTRSGQISRDPRTSSAASLSQHENTAKFRTPLPAWRRMRANPASVYTNHVLPAPSLNPPPFPTARLILQHIPNTVTSFWSRETSR